jgi:acetylornithine deacetylase
MRRYGPVDTAIYVHPAESGDGLREVKMASLGLLEYNIEIEGKGPDSTDPHQAIFSKTAVSAVAKGVAIYQGMHAWAAEAAQRYSHEGLEKLAGQSFAMAEGFFRSGGNEHVYKIPTRCTIEGTLCFPPEENLEAMKDEFRQVFDRLVAQDSWLADGHAHLEWGDQMGESIQSDEESEFLRMATGVLTAVTGQEPEYYYGHSVSDIRYPLLYWNAQAFGVGPLSGDLAKETEWVDRKEYLDTIVAVAEMLRHAA